MFIRYKSFNSADQLVLDRLLAQELQRVEGPPGSGARQIVLHLPNQLACVLHASAYRTFCGVPKLTSFCLVPVPLPYLAVAAVTGFVFNLLSDGPLGGRRWPVALFCNVGNFAVALGLLFIPLYTDIPGRFALYYLNYINTGAAMAIYSWQAESTAFDVRSQGVQAEAERV